MGKYDALFQDGAPAAVDPKPAGKYAALFDEATPAAPAESPSFLQQVAQPFKDIGNSLLAANDFAARAIAHPIDTLTSHPGATFREGMRGVNSNIPFANAAVEAMGGPPAESPADAAAAPGASAFGGVAGAPAGGMVGGLAAKGVEVAAPAIGRAIGAVGEAAQGRQVNRALENLEMKTYKRTRAGVRSDVVADAVTENPELRQAAGNDVKVKKTIDDMRTKATDEINRQYAGYKVTLGDSIDNLNARIKALRTGGTSTDAAVADHIESIRDEIAGRLSKRDSISVKELRAEQTDFQKKGYGKAMPGDEAASARIEANREASKAIGDAVVKRVTGLDYAEAKAAAAADPNGIPGRLFKANDQISAANKLDAAIADRAARVQPKEGVAGKLIEIGKKLRHSPVGYALSLAPDAAAGTLNAVDNRLAGLAGGGAQALGDSVGSAAASASSNVALSKLIRAAQAGTVSAQLVQEAIAAGVPRATAVAAANMATNPTPQYSAPGVPAPAYPSGVPLAGR